jgi:hypothetical protein
VVSGTLVVYEVAQFLTNDIGFLPELPIYTLGTKDMIGEEVGSIWPIGGATNALGPCMRAFGG